MPLFSNLIKIISEQNPTHKDFLIHSLSHLNKSERALANSYIKHCITYHCSLDELAQAYLRIVNDTLKEQMFFKRYGRYRYKSFSEVSENVYYCSTYMNKYMLGLALSSFLWPNHVSINRFFMDALLNYGKRGGNYLEVGPGHGLFFYEACKFGQFKTYSAIDISPTSLALTRTLINDWLVFEEKNHKLIEGDFLRIPIYNHFDAIVMGEILEHVEDPVSFLKRMRELAAPNALLFITTCINAPAVDHIYLYEDFQSIKEHISISGLKISKQITLPYAGKTIAESIQNRLPMNIALLLHL